MAKPSIALLLGTHHDHEDKEPGEDEAPEGDMDEHGEALAEDFCHACKTGDAAQMWELFKKMCECAEHAPAGGDGEEDEDEDEA
jgi:hypothetical protein